MWLVFHFRNGSRLFLQVTEVMLLGDGMTVRDAHGARHTFRMVDVDSIWICTHTAVANRLHKTLVAIARRLGEGQDDEVGEEGDDGQEG